MAEPSNDTRAGPQAGDRADYAQWIDRLRATAQSVAFCCAYQLADRSLADAVGARVVAGLIGRPGIFKYSGLPYSGRVARHTERGIELARSGALIGGLTWDRLERRLQAVDHEHRALMIHAWVDDRPDQELATVLGCEQSEAVARKERSLRFWETLSNDVLAETGG